MGRGEEIVPVAALDQVLMRPTRAVVQVGANDSGRLTSTLVQQIHHEPALATQTVLEEPLVAALPSGHRLGHHKRLSLAMLAGEPFVLQARSRGPGSHDQVLAICRSAGFSPRVVQEGSNAEVASLVASGAGVAIVPTSLRAIRRAGVVYRPLQERPISRLDMVWRKDASLPVLREFLAEVRRMGVSGSGRMPRRRRPRIALPAP